MTEYVCYVVRRDGVSVRVEVLANDRLAAIRAALAKVPGVSAAACPAISPSQIVLNDLGVRMSPFPLTVKP